jgi:hypothetical protein
VRSYPGRIIGRSGSFHCYTCTAPWISVEKTDTLPSSVFRQKLFQSRTGTRAINASLLYSTVCLIILFLAS